MTIIQWVNLEKNEAYANDPDIGDIERCGPLSVKALFAKTGIPLSFSVRAVPVGEDNVEYSDAEQQRNPNFKMPNEISRLATEKEVLLDGAVKLPAAGGNKYRLEAKDANGATVESVEVVAKRKLYYQLMYMEDNNGGVRPHALTQLENHCSGNEVVLTKVGENKRIAFHKTITTSTDGNFNYRDFYNLVSDSYDIPDALKKCGCVCVWSNYIARMVLFDDIKISHVIGGAPSPRLLVRENKVIIKIEEGYLWHGLDDLDDQQNRWFKSCKIEHSPARSNDSKDVTTIWLDRNSVEVFGTPSFVYGGYNKVEISMSPELNELLRPGDEVIFTFELNLARFTGGFSYDDGKVAITTCCTKSWWRDVPAARSEQIWNHEIGHRMGMVAYGDKDHRTTNQNHFVYRPYLPDAPSTLYGENRRVNDKEHKGPHCENGVLFNTSTKKWSGTPRCVMFGATGTREGHAPLDYCSECKPIVKKLDLSFDKN